MSDEHRCLVRRRPGRREERTEGGAWGRSRAMEQGQPQGLERAPPTARLAQRGGYTCLRRLVHLPFVTRMSSQCTLHQAVRTWGRRVVAGWGLGETNSRARRSFRETKGRVCCDGGRVTLHLPKSTDVQHQVRPPRHLWTWAMDGWCGSSW